MSAVPPIHRILRDENQSDEIPIDVHSQLRRYVMLHANWINVFISLLEEKRFSVSDPFVAYCAAVAATLHL